MSASSSFLFEQPASAIWLARLAELTIAAAAAAGIALSQWNHPAIWLLWALGCALNHWQGRRLLGWKSIQLLAPGGLKIQWQGGHSEATEWLEWRSCRAFGPLLLLEGDNGSGRRQVLLLLPVLADERQRQLKRRLALMKPSRAQSV